MYQWIFRFPNQSAPFKLLTKFIFSREIKKCNRYKYLIIISVCRSTNRHLLTLVMSALSVFTAVFEGSSDVSVAKYCIFWSRIMISQEGNSSMICSNANIKMRKYRTKISVVNHAVTNHVSKVFLRKDSRICFYLKKRYN